MARKLKIGMIGCGNISALYTDIYAQLTDIAQIVATADIDPTRAASRAAGLTTAYSAEAFRQEAMMHNARTRGQDEAHDAARQSAEDARGTRRSTRSSFSQIHRFVAYRSSPLPRPVNMSSPRAPWPRVCRKPMRSSPRWKRLV